MIEFWKLEKYETSRSPGTEIVAFVDWNFQINNSSTWYLLELMYRKSPITDQFAPSGNATNHLIKTRFARISSELEVSHWIIEFTNKPSTSYRKLCQHSPSYLKSSLKLRRYYDVLTNLSTSTSVSCILFIRRRVYYILVPQRPQRELWSRYTSIPFAD